MANPTITVTGRDNASAVLSQVERSVKKLGTSFDLFKSYTAILSKFSVVLGALYTASRAVTVVTDLAKAFDDLDESAQGLGVTALQLKEMQTAARLAGLEGEQLNKVLTKFNLRVTEANQGNKESAEYFRRLGIELKEAGKQRPTLELFNEFSDRMKSFGNTTERAAFQVGFFNEKIGPKAAAYVSGGADALRKFSGATQDTVDKGLALQLQIDRLSVAFDTVKNAVFTKTAPALTAFLEALGDIKIRGNAATTAVGLLIDVMERLRKLAPDSERWKAFAEQTPKPITEPTPGGFTMPFRQDTGGIGAPAPVSPEELAKRAAAAAEAARKQAEALRIAAEEAHNYQRAGLDKYQREYASEGARANAVLDEHNRLTQEAINIAEEDRQAKLAVSRANQEAIDRRSAARVDSFNAEADKLKASFEDIGLVFESAVSRMFTEGNVTARNFWKSILTDMQQVLTKALIMKPIMESLKKVFMSMGTSATGGGYSWLGAILSAMGGAFGAKASGGPVAAGGSYVVGESGPELFRPSGSGTIVPNNQLGMGGVSLVQNISIDSRSDAATIRMAIDASRQLAVRDIGDMLKRRRM